MDKVTKYLKRIGSIGGKIGGKACGKVKARSTECCQKAQRESVAARLRNRKARAGK